MPDDLASFPIAADGTFRSMRALVDELARDVVGREDVVRAVQAAASAGKGRTVLVVGEAGSGKTAALAALAAREPLPAAVHFVGRELGRDDPRSVARSLAAQLGVAAPDEHGAAIAAFHGALEALAKQGKRAVVVIDGIARLRGAEDGAATELLPSAVPSGVLLVLSSRPGPIADAIARVPGVGRLALAPLRDDARLAIAKAIAPERADDVRAAAARACAGNPLFLRALLLADPGSTEPLAATPAVAFGRLLNRLARSTSLDATRVLGLVAAAPSGLTRDDLAALMSSPRGPVDALVDAAAPWLRERDGRVIVAEGRLRDWIVEPLVGASLPALCSAIADRLAAGAATSRADSLVDLTAVLDAAGRGVEIADLVDGRFARLKSSVAGAESLRDDLVRAIGVLAGDVVRAARYGVAAALLRDASGARALRVKALAAAAKALPKKDGWELAEKATQEAFVETDAARRDEAVVAAVSALRGIDADEARRVASGQPRGVARVRALVASGDLASALAEVDESPEAEREAALSEVDDPPEAERDAALSEVLEPLAASDAQEVTKLLPKLRDAARRDRVLAALVTATKGMFLAGKIGDVARRASALAKLGEWDEAELAIEEASGAARPAAHEQIAAAARAANESARAAAHEANATKARAALATAAERAASAREGAAIATAANPARAIALADESVALDHTWASTRDALVLRARAVLAKPSGAAVHEVIVSLAPFDDALAAIYPELVGALATAFGSRHMDAVRAAVDAVDWADRFVATLRAPAASKTIAPPPLAPEVAREVSSLPWSAVPSGVEAPAAAATADDVERLVDAKLAAGDRAGAVGELLAWATRLRALGERVDAAAAEERARAIDPSDPRHRPASMRPPPTPAGKEDESVDGGWDDDGEEPHPKTVRQDTPRGAPPWSPGPAPAKPHTATILGIAAVPVPAPTPAPPPPDVPTPPPPPPEPEQEFYEEDEADQTSIMGAAERKALQKAARAGDAAALKDTAQQIADAHDPGGKKAGAEAARKILAERDAEPAPEAYERPTVPPAPLGDTTSPAIPPPPALPSSPTSPAAASPAPMPVTSPAAVSVSPIPAAVVSRSGAPAPMRRPSSRPPAVVVKPRKSPALVALGVGLIVLAIAIVLVRLFVVKR